MNQLTHKLYHFEEAPPEKNWGAIADALNHQLAPVAQTLSHFQQAPAPFIWDKIETQLQQENTTVPVVSFTQKHKKLFKYISAAAVLLLVASVITVFLIKSSSEDKLAIQPQMQNALSEPQNTPNNVAPDSGNTNDEAESDPDLLTIEKEKPVEQTAEQNKGKQARYITVAVESGKKVRLSKKAYTVFNCAENADLQKSERCKENIEAMQQKMAASLHSPSGDFGGFIDMLKSLEENE